MKLNNERGVNKTNRTETQLKIKNIQLSWWGIGQFLSLDFSKYLFKEGSMDSKNTWFPSAFQ